jgi:alpha-L-fucosidase
VPPTPAGLLHETDVARLKGMRSALDQRFGAPIEVASRMRTSEMAGTTGRLELALAQPRRVGFVTLQEEIVRGQHVAAWRLEGLAGDGSWKPLARGTTIGYKRIVALPPAEHHGIRLVIEQAFAPVESLSMVLHGEG